MRFMLENDMCARDKRRLVREACALGRKCEQAMTRAADSAMFAAVWRASAEDCSRVAFDLSRKFRSL